MNEALIAFERSGPVGAEHSLRPSGKFIQTGSSQGCHSTTGIINSSSYIKAASVTDFSTLIPAAMGIEVFPALYVANFYSRANSVTDLSTLIPAAMGIEVFPANFYSSVRQLKLIIFPSTGLSPQSCIIMRGDRFQLLFKRCADF